MQTNIHPIGQSNNQIPYEIENHLNNNEVEDEKEVTRKKLQNGVYLFGGFGFVFLIVFFVLVYTETIVLSGKYQENDLKLSSQRLEFTLRYQALGLLFVAALILFIATRRFFSPAIDPTSNNEEVVQKYKNILQNTLEQFVLSSITQLVLTANLSAKSVMIYIPFMSITFFAGRIIYAFTYPNRRTFGFFFSFYTNYVGDTLLRFSGLSILSNHQKNLMNKILA